MECLRRKRSLVSAMRKVKSSMPVREATTMSSNRIRSERSWFKFRKRDGLFHRNLRRTGRLAAVDFFTLEAARRWPALRGHLSQSGRRILTERSQNNSKGSDMAQRHQAEHLSEENKA